MKTILTLLILAFASPLMAQGLFKKKKRQVVRPVAEATVIVKNTFSLVDLDNNGEITHAEFRDHVRSFSFKHLDKNRDGNISLTEWRAIEGRRSDDVFNDLDTNRNRVISYQEFLGRPAAPNRPLFHVFRTLDANRDGVILVGEFAGPDLIEHSDGTMSEMIR